MILLQKANIIALVARPGVLIVIQLWDEVCLHPQEGVPVDPISNPTREVVMLFQLVSSGRAQPVQGVLSQECCDDVLCLWLDWEVVLLRPLYVVIDCVSKQLLRGLTPKRRATDQQLVEDHTHAPPVYGLAITLMTREHQVTQ